MQNPRLLLESMFKRNNNEILATGGRRWIMDCDDFIGQVYQSTDWYTFITCSPTYLYIAGSKTLNHKIVLQQIMVELLSDIGFDCKIVKINPETEKNGFTYLLLEIDDFTLPLLRDIEFSFATRTNKKKVNQKLPLLPSFYTKDMRVEGTLTIPDVDAEFRQ